TRRRPLTARSRWIFSGATPRATRVSRCVSTLCSAVDTRPYPIFTPPVLHIPLICARFLRYTYMQRRHAGAVRSPRRIAGVALGDRLTRHVACGPSALEGDRP